MQLPILRLPLRERLSPRRTLLILRSVVAPAFLLGSGLLGFGLLGSCAAGAASEGSGTPTRILLRDYRVNLDVELVNDAYGDRLAYYSSKRSKGQTGRKFQTDEVMDAMLELLDDEGWGRYAQEGIAPRDGARVISSAFELERNGKTSHWKIGDGSDLDMRKSFVECKKAFMALYQETAGFQAVKDANVENTFSQPQLGRSQRSSQGSSFR